MKHQVKVNLELLDKFRSDTESILFIDLIKRMLQRDPNERDTCDKLMKHAFFMDDEERAEIIQDLSKKYFTEDELHLEGSLGAESDPWLI